MTQPTRRQTLRAAIALGAAAAADEALAACTFRFSNTTPSASASASTTFVPTTTATPMPSTPAATVVPQPQPSVTQTPVPQFTPFSPSRVPNVHFKEIKATFPLPRHEIESPQDRKTQLAERRELLGRYNALLPTFEEVARLVPGISATTLAVVSMFETGLGDPRYSHEGEQPTFKPSPVMHFNLLTMIPLPPEVQAKVGKGHYPHLQEVWNAAEIILAPLRPFARHAQSLENLSSNPYVLAWSLVEDPRVDVGGRLVFTYFDMTGELLDVPNVASPTRTPTPSVSAGLA